VPFRKRWFAPLAGLAAAAAVGILTFSIPIHREEKPTGFAPTEAAPTVRLAQAEAVRDSLADAGTKPTTKRAKESSVIAREVAVAAPPEIPTVNPASAAPSEVIGTITDPAGAAISGAAVRLRPLAGPDSRNTRTDDGSRYFVSGLLPGRYELQVTAPGFQQAKKDVDVNGALPTRADASLPIGAVSETVSVSAEAVTLGTERAVPVTGPRAPGVPLPNVRSGPLSAVRGKVMLVTDSAGALRRSDNAGKKWKVVKPVWQGKLAGLTTVSELFQLTTDAGGVRLSRDGSHWYPAPTRKSLCKISRFLRSPFESAQRLRIAWARMDWSSR
jgi:hypothetical protein